MKRLESEYIEFAQARDEARIKRINLQKKQAELEEANIHLHELEYRLQQNRRRSVPLYRPDEQAEYVALVRQHQETHEEILRLKSEIIVDEKVAKLSEGVANGLEERLRLLVELDTSQTELTNRAGYTVIDLPDAEKSNFHDLLKGFEDYAKLKGYDVSISVDPSVQDKIGFKFTFGKSLRTVTQQQLQTDLAEYIDKVEKGDRLDDLPIVLPEQQHQSLLVSMRNRINFLNYNINFQRNELEWHKNFLKNLSEGKVSIIASQLSLAAPQIHLRAHAKTNSGLSWEEWCNSIGARSGAGGNRGCAFGHRRL